MTDHLHSTLIDFARVSDKQQEKGLRKYGQAIDPMDDYDWIEMAMEEVADMVQYIHAEKLRKRTITTKIKNLTDDKEIHDLLDQLATQ